MTQGFFGTVYMSITFNFYDSWSRYNAAEFTEQNYPQNVML